MTLSKLSDTSKNEIEIYADEILNKDFNFLVISCLFVPFKNKQRLTDNLLNSRCLLSENTKWYNYDTCPLKDACKSRYHTLNDAEIHNTRIIDSASYATKKISQRWLSYFMRQKEAYFNMLFIDMEKLDVNLFGDDSQSANIYNKFFRTTITYGIKSFFSGYNKTIVKNIFHDNNDSFENHHYFKYLNMIRLANDLGTNNLIFENPTIRFIDSDHKNETTFNKESNLIQFVDLIGGMIKQNLFYTSKDKTKIETALIVRSLIVDLMNDPFKNDYVRVGFFPREKIENARQKFTSLTGEMHELYLNEFYKKREILMPDTRIKNLMNWKTSQI